MPGGAALMIELTVKVKRGKQALGKSVMRFSEGAYTATDLQALYAPVILGRALAEAVENGMRCDDDAL